MSRLNVKSPLKAAPAINAVTHEGNTGFASDAKSELFRLGVNLFAGEDTYYETGAERNTRFTDLVKQIALDDPEWLAEFLKWLRSEGNVRTASIMGAVDAINARLHHVGSGGTLDEVEIDGKGFNRALISSVVQRADELGEVAAYQAMAYPNTLGKKRIPISVKRGLSDAARKLINEQNWLKWDSDARSWRMADVIEMCHVAPKDPRQEELFKLIIADRHGNEYAYDRKVLKKIASNEDLRELAKTTPSVLSDPDFLRDAGFTWEDALSLAGDRVPKVLLWDALINSGQLGHMAAIRNLRNIQEAGVSDKKTLAKLIDIVSSEESVKYGRQFPFRYWSAAENAKSSLWVEPINRALTYSTRNIPELPGRTLILIDTSGSMTASMSGRSKMQCVDAAALFGAATALRNPDDVDLVIFASTSMPIHFSRGDSVLSLIKEIRKHNVGYGTETASAIRKYYKSGYHDRVMIFTDMQSFPSGLPVGHGLHKLVDKDTWMYAWDLSGYKYGDIPSGEGKVHQLSGLSDGTFKLIPLLESGTDAGWPWENK